MGAACGAPQRAAPDAGAAPLAAATTSAPAPPSSHGQRWPAPLEPVGQSPVVAHGHGAYVARVSTSDARAWAARQAPLGLVACAAHTAAGGEEGPTTCWRVERGLPLYLVRSERGGQPPREGRLDDCAGCHDPGPRLGP